MTHKTAKINFINSGAVDIIRTVYNIHGPELMKLIFLIILNGSTISPRYRLYFSVGKFKILAVLCMAY